MEDRMFFIKELGGEEIKSVLALYESLVKDPTMHPACISGIAQCH
jgi:hypothetical protein